MAVLMLFVIALPFGAGTAFATTNITNSNSSQINTITNNNTVNVTEKTVTQQANTTETNASVKNSTKTAEPTTPTTNSSSKILAAGSPATASTTTTTTQTSFTSAQINSAAVTVKSFVETNHRLPTYVTISTHQVTMPQFLELLVKNILNYNSGLSTSVALKTVNSPASATETVKSGDISKSEYITLAKSILNTITSTGTAPSYVNSSLGKIKFQNLVYTYSKILSFENTNKRLPNYVSVNSWSSISSSEGSSGSSSIPAALLPYLQPTTNAQSNDPTIKALAASITKGLTTPYDKASAIFYWVRDHITYSFYYNTKYGAVGTLKAGTGNCVDTTHLMVALARAAGIPAEYQHGTVTFSDGTYGHVWAKLYVNGQWYYADGTSKYSSLSINHPSQWKAYSISHTYITLPF